MSSGLFPLDYLLPVCILLPLKPLMTNTLILDLIPEISEGSETLLEEAQKRQRVPLRKTDTVRYIRRYRINSV